MISVRGEQVVIGSQRGQRGNSRCFLANVKMIVPTEDPSVMKRNEALFKVADDEHSTAPIEHRVAGNFRQHRFDLLKTLDFVNFGSMIVL